MFFILKKNFQNFFVINIKIKNVITLLIILRNLVTDLILIKYFNFEIFNRKIETHHETSNLKNFM